MTSTLILMVRAIFSHPAPAMTTGLGRLFLLAVFVLFVCSGMPARAEVPSKQQIAETERSITKIEAYLDRPSAHDDEIEATLRLSAEIRRQSMICITGINSEIDRIKTLIGETTSADDQGGDTNLRISELKDLLGTCQNYVLRTDAAIGDLTILKKQRQTEKFRFRGRHVFSALQEVFSSTAGWSAIGHPVAGIFFLPSPPGLLDWALIISMALAGAALGFRLRAQALDGPKLAPLVLGATGLLAGLTFAYASLPAPALVIGWQLLAVLCLIQLSAVLPRPVAEPDRARTGWRIGGFLIVAMAGHHLNLAFENARPVPEVEFARLLIFAAIFAAAIPATRHIRFLVLFERAWKSIRAVFLVGFALALIAELTGYRALATFLLTGFTGSLTAIILYSLIQRGGDGIISSLNSGDAAWSVAVKRYFGFPPHDLVPGLFWLRLFFEVLVFAIFILGVFTVWGLSDSNRDALLKSAIDGFEIWGITLVPGRVIGGLLLFALLLMVSRRVRDIAERRLTVDLHIDPGGRDALVTLLGYVGAVVAVIAGLSWAGFSFDKLALVAGALSVGIGFGLQNVVSNFVSGLILLFEQPFRSGDWIVVGGTEGIVKKIRVRATEIQKFDKTEVIVPNADFVTGTVTNYTLRSNMGRVFLQIGVAYGSNTEQVREILLDIARGHPRTLLGGGLAPEPMVHFMAFGDSALNFEVRVYINDVNSRLSVTSDLNFAIDKAFREHNIEIPFPQSDIHVRDWPALPGSKPTK